MQKGVTKFEPKRVMMLRELLQMSQVAFANKINISQGALSQIESGKSQISMDTLRNISNELGVNCNWLVNGTGEVFYKAEENQQAPFIQKVLIDLKLENISAIPLVDEEAHAGYIEGRGDFNYIRKLKVYQIPGYEKGSYRLFEVAGKSMMPTIHPREVVICEFVEDEDTIENGTICVVVTTDGIIAKRIFYYENDKNLIILKSDNNKFKTYSMEGKKILEVWEVKGKITSAFIESANSDIKRMSKLENDLETLKKEVKMLSVK